MLQISMEEKAVSVKAAKPVVTVSLPALSVSVDGAIGSAAVTFDTEDAKIVFKVNGNPQPELEDFAAKIKDAEADYRSRAGRY